ncbi:MAG TPA: histidine kinase [Puia sp.]|nr:histidine kinase [Puia sp.]
MNAATHRKLFLYSSLFITLTMNMPRLLALRKNGLVAHFWHFDLTQLLFDLLMTFLFCLAIFYFNKDRIKIFLSNGQLPKQLLYTLINLLILGVFIAISFAAQSAFFQQGIFPAGGSGFRLTVSLLLAAIELRVILMLEESRAREIENQQLRNAYLKAELEILKGQLNPHFFFNSLSSLSAVVREDPPKAQQYINHLSRVFRYSLQRNDEDLISLKEELNVVRSYAELLKMRYEEGFDLQITIDESQYASRVPHMSLQLLIENALKHNIASAAKPLKIEISILGTPEGRKEDQLLQVKNNLQPVHFPEPGAGIGLANLNERYKILMHREIEINKTATSFIVKLPLN